MSGLLDTFPYALIWIKWTCPGCGERVTADEPNTFCTQGYLHTTREDGTPCGIPYDGHLFGLRLIIAHTPEARAAILKGARPNDG